MKKLIKLLLKPFNWVVFQYNSYIHNPLIFWSHKKRALNLHNQTGLQFHVVPMSGNKLVIISKRYHKTGECISLVNYNTAMRKTGGKQLDIVDILKMAYYSTPTKR